MKYWKIKNATLALHVMNNYLSNFITSKSIFSLKNLKMNIKIEFTLQPRVRPSLNERNRLNN